jgi:hypothetical protein
MKNMVLIDAVSQMGIDERVNKLIGVLNDLPAINTFSSCGGHENPRGSQVKSDSFYIYFSIETVRNRPSKKGWESLGIIERATTLGNIDYTIKFGEKDFLYYSITICNLTDGDDKDSLSMLDFELTGRFSADPNVLADIIKNIERDLHFSRPRLKTS